MFCLLIVALVTISSVLFFLIIFLTLLCSCFLIFSSCLLECGEFFFHCIFARFDTLILSFVPTACVVSFTVL